MRTLRFLLVFLLFFACSALAQDDNLQYRERGGYFEGYRSQPVSSGRGYRVVSFRVMTDDKGDILPDRLVLGFFADDKSKVYPVVQLCDQESHYLLDQINPKKIQSHDDNYHEFSWKSKDVLAQLMEKPSLREIAAVVRLESPEARSDQHLVPVILTGSPRNLVVRGYVLDLYVAETVDVTCTLKEVGGSPVVCQELGDLKKIEGDTYTTPIRIPADSLVDNRQYVLSIEGSFASNPGRAISQRVYFQHRETWKTDE